MSKKIMVVDNESNTVELVKSILGGNGYTLTEAYSGLECIEKIKNKKQDLVLLDTMMPDLSGWDTYNRLRKEDKHTKVAFLSVIEVSHKRREKLLLNGLSDYIIKPFTADELVGRVNKILSD